MMRLLLLSDLHLEFGTSLTLPADLDYDVVVLAGDIHSPGRKAVRWARASTFRDRPVIYVPGNHEFYGATHIDHELEEMRSAAHGTKVHILDRDCVVIGGVRFLGCTLWTDFCLPVRVGDDLISDTDLALKAANWELNDFTRIRVADAKISASHRSKSRRRLQAEDTLTMHWRDREWLRSALQTPHDGPTVVVTHHAPSAGSVAAQYAGESLTPAFVSDLPGEFFEVPRLWVHGHTHTPADYVRGQCRVLSNPRGYRMWSGKSENHMFDSGMVIELPLDDVGRAGQEDMS